ncbi:DUF2442 domain-containing protein [Microvirga pudoricolor]|uniref:DUF2442 domain-containing protein n=1 Tax=Microvirga pudoricolor TaxID=2778729 RepID=UPI00195075D1|nr:DUF2442 domain-containing protein [Microvirga pudoricolor]MBM6595023.1 DUF2442 domain-containing protein [Microvirga pudoricolor]
MTLIKVVSVQPLDGYRLALEFSDGSKGEKDLTSLVLWDRAILAELRDPAVFSSVFLQRGAPTWPNGFDLAPWALHDDLTGQNALMRPSRVA